LIEAEENDLTLRSNAERGVSIRAK